VNFFIGVRSVPLNFPTVRVKLSASPLLYFGICTYIGLPRILKFAVTLPIGHLSSDTNPTDARNWDIGYIRCHLEVRSGLIIFPPVLRLTFQGALRVTIILSEPIASDCVEIEILRS
jgi:hypothetical protein